MVSLCLTAQSAQLEYNLKKGDKYLIDMQMKQNMAPIMTMDIGISMTMKTTAVKSDGYDTEYQISRMKMDMEAQGESIKFDSNKADSELTQEEKKMKAEIAPTLEMIVYQTIEKSGKITSVKMVPEVKGAGAMMGQNQFTSMVYPTEPVKVGSTWDHDQNMNGMNIKLTYKITQITGNRVYVDITGNMVGAADAKVKGKMIIDRVSGMFSSMDMNISMDMMGANMGMSITATSKKI